MNELLQQNTRIRYILYILMHWVQNVVHVNAQECAIYVHTNQKACM